MPKKEPTRSMSLTSQESYSAVIIADMVAEVRSDPEDDTPEQPKQNNHKPEPDINGSLEPRINPGFDPSYSTPAAVVDVEMVETTVGGGRNGGISKGVILNATQFGHSDKLVPDPLKMDGAHRLSGQQKRGSSASGPVDFKHMSIPRKIAFGLSFLPSIMFVLCFAVILPCKEPTPCLREVWSNTLKGTAVTSDVVVSGNGVFYASTSSSRKSSAEGVSLESGAVTWTASLKSPARFVQCARLENREVDSCLVVEDSGRLTLYNASNGHLQWDKGHFGPSSPVVLPDCEGDGVSELALGVSEGQVKVLMNGAILTTINVTGCGSVPASLTSWRRNNETTDLLFTCKRENEEFLMKLPQSRWCSSNKKTSGPKEDVRILDSRSAGAFEKSVLLATEDGLVLWVEDDVIMFDSDGEQQWKVSSFPHSSDNRFLLYGKFNETDNQVALFSSSLRSSLRVSTLSSVNGEEAWAKAESNLEVSDASLIHGKEKDFAVVSTRKAKGSLASEAMDTIGAMSSTIMSVLTSENIATNETLSSSARVIEDIAFLEFGSKFLQSIEEREVSYAEDGLFKSTVTVVPNENGDAETISMIILRNPTDKTKDMTSLLRRIDVANWDISLSKESHCKWRQ